MMTVGKSPRNRVYIKSNTLQGDIKQIWVESTGNAKRDEIVCPCGACKHHVALHTDRGTFFYAAPLDSYTILVLQKRLHAVFPSCKHFAGNRSHYASMGIVCDERMVFVSKLCDAALKQFGYEIPPSLTNEDQNRVEMIRSMSTPRSTFCELFTTIRNNIIYMFGNSPRFVVPVEEAPQERVDSPVILSEAPVVDPIPEQQPVVAVAKPSEVVLDVESHQMPEERVIFIDDSPPVVQRENQPVEQTTVIVVIPHVRPTRVRTQVQRYKPAKNDRPHKSIAK